MKNRLVMSYQDRLLLCFAAGILCGTAAANLLSGELKQQIGFFDTLFVSERALDFARQRQMWLCVLRQRSAEMLGAWLLSLTVFSAAGFCALAAMAGGSIAVVLSVITMQKGMLGLVFYLATIVPHALFYVPVALILASWAGEKEHRVRVPALLLLAALLVAGTAAEAWLSPGIIRFFTNL